MCTIYFDVKYISLILDLNGCSDHLAVVEQRNARTHVNIRSVHFRS